MNQNLQKWSSINGEKRRTACFPKLVVFRQHRRAEGTWRYYQHQADTLEASRFNPAAFLFWISASFCFPCSPRMSLWFSLKSWLSVKIQTLGNSTGWKTPCLQQINCKEKKSRKWSGKNHDSKILKKTKKLTNCSLQTLFGSWIKQANLNIYVLYLHIFTLLYNT